MSVVREDGNEYLRLIQRFPLRPIRNEKQNKQAAAICDDLTERLPTLTADERDYLDVLTTLIEQYESKWDSKLTRMSPRDLIQYLMEQNSLAQKDLIPEFGSASRVSEFLKGQRDLSLEQARRLAQRFSLNIAALLTD